jgi:hypothetical protein
MIRSLSEIAFGFHRFTGKAYSVEVREPGNFEVRNGWAKSNM